MGWEDVFYIKPFQDIDFEMESICVILHNQQGYLPKKTQINDSSQFST